jgi:hypothetical protein
MVFSVSNSTVPGTPLPAPPPPASPLASPPAQIPVFEKKEIPQAVIKQCRNIFFRQSLLKDYLKCPNMSLYRWVLNLDQQPPWLSATMGTAGHYAIYKMHQQRKYDFDYLSMLSLLEEGFNAEIAKADAFPQIPASCQTIQEAFADKSNEFVNLLLGYQYHPMNQSFHSTMHEQSFVLEVPSVDEDMPPYLFTGQIDQGGFYDSGDFVVRDLKFRDNNFRPSKTELDLDIQFTIYSTAIKYGKPACTLCRPKYNIDPFTGAAELIYHGPCESCKAKIGTPQWPQRYANRCEMVWMRDFDIHKKDQHDEWVIDNTKPKIPNPKGKGPPVYPRKRNPDFDSGYKKGQYKGVGFMSTIRAPSSLAILMSDVLRVCDHIRHGMFHRNPGDACNFFCRFREQCLKGLELEIEEANLATVSAIGTDDPW